MTVTVQVITPAAVLQAVQAGADTVWALAARFEVSAASRDLHAALFVLMADGSVVASLDNLYHATLKAVN